MKAKVISTSYLLPLFIGVLLIRLFFNAVLPLMDQTEARYAEIARLMYETGNWVVLQIDYGVPFWAKPPLSTWAGALSLSLFGVTEFAVRLPYFLVCTGIALWMGRYRASKNHPFILPGFILLSIPEFYLHAGVVSTDVFLLMSVAIVMLSFWETMQQNSKKFWGYLFFIGMGMGVLAKGPIVGILTLPPILFWCWRTGNVIRALKKAPWLGGGILFLLVAVPWYVLSELRSPGFIDYFIVGEHFNRYFNSEWKGDKYGFPKQQPLGIIWAFFVAFTLPWIVGAIRLLFRQKMKITSHPWVLFLVVWMLWPLLFFSVSKSLIHPYILPSIIPFALVISHFWDSLKAQKSYVFIASSIPILLFCVYSSGLVNSIFKDNTDKYLIQSVPKGKVLSLQHKSYSSRFYTQGDIQKIESLENFKTLEPAGKNYVLIRHKDFQELPDSQQEKLTLLEKNKKKGIYRFE